MTLADVAPETIVILSTPTCSRCKFVGKHLDAKGVDYEFVDLSDPDNADFLAEFQARNLSNVPQTFKGDSDWVEGVDFAKIESLF